MNDLEKSEKLVRLCGWSIASVERGAGFYDFYHHVLLDENKAEIIPTVKFGGGTQPRAIELSPRKQLNLYDPANMALAWRVLNWAILEQTAQLAHIATWLAIGGFMSMPPEIAQRIWIDKVFELAIEAGMID